MDTKTTLIKTRSRYEFVQKLHGFLLVISSIIFVLFLTASMIQINSFFDIYKNVIGVSAISFVLLILIFFNGYYYREMYLNVDNIDLFYMQYKLAKRDKFFENEDKRRE